MGSADLTSRTAPPPPSALTRPALPSPMPAKCDTTCQRGVFDELRWYYRANADAMLRHVPGSAWSTPQDQGWQRVKQTARRDVWRAQIAGSTFYLKYHFAETGIRRLTRRVRSNVCRTEWDGGLYALQAGIPAIPPAAYTTDLRRDGRRCALFITEAIEPALPLSEFWLQLQSDADPRRRRTDTAQLIERLAEMIARAHQSGFEHLDMHAANILVHTVGPRCYHTVFVDLQSARRGVPLHDRAVVRNLAQLNQWFRRHSSIGDRLRFLRAYLRWRNEYETGCAHGRALEHDFSGLVRALVRAAERHAARLWAQRDRRVLRDGRYFARIRGADGWRGIVVLGSKHVAEESAASRMRLDRAWWKARLAEPLRWFEAGGARACKDSHSATVCRTTLAHPTGELPIIVKRPRARNGWRRLAQLLPPSRSARAWRIGHALLHRDIPAARPLAVLERRIGPLVRDNLLITEALPGAVDLESLLRNEYAKSSPQRWYRLKLELARLLVPHLRRLGERGFDHRDCKASNILVASRPRRKLLWIDLDGLRRVRRLSPARRLRPLMRLHVSLMAVPGITRTDRLRVLKSYCARFGAPPDAWRTAWRTIAAQAERKIHAKAARTAWKRAHYGRE